MKQSTPLSRRWFLASGAAAAAIPPLISAQAVLKQAAALKVAVLAEVPRSLFERKRALEWAYFPKTTAFIETQTSGPLGPPRGMAHAMGRMHKVKALQLAEAGPRKVRAFERECRNLFEGGA